MNRMAKAGLAAGLAVLALLALASLSVGSRAVPLRDVTEAFLAFDPHRDSDLIVRALRVPRTLLAIVCGMSLGLAGTIMQAITRNSLAEPGLLGVNAGAGTAVIVAVSVFHLSEYQSYVWFGFLGAGLAGIAVFVLGQAHRSGTNTVRLVLAGAGVSIVLGAVIGTVVLNAPLEVLDRFRHWSAGSLDGRGFETVMVLIPIVVGGMLGATAIARQLNAIAMGEELARALGVNLGMVWTVACLCVMLLAGGATAAAGPIGFVGLVAPHLARFIAGPDYRWLLPSSALFGAIILLLADMVGRLLAAPSEVAAGIVVMLMGGPFFILVVRRSRVRQL